MLEIWSEYWPLLAAMLVVLIAIPTLGLYMTYIERKVAASMQDRIGPNRVGPAGLLQAVADGLKIFLKEQIVPAHVDKWIYLVAPAIGVVTSMLAFAVVPFWSRFPSCSSRGFPLHHRPWGRDRPDIRFRRFEFVCLFHHPGRLGLQQSLQPLMARSVPVPNPSVTRFRSVFRCWEFWP